ncbi:unnamed protein product [Haemonchus placei]|uniref:DSBA domain-containing protein n=1 Tax=Haemonchus placei TaxID=6290 RepID=A0A0N4W4R2_HAEPC|nr:unnamed protein product [Haemonchus placei]
MSTVIEKFCQAGSLTDRCFSIESEGHARRSGNRRRKLDMVLAASKIENASEYIDRIDSSSAMTLLFQNTKAALDTGAFGAPWIVVYKDGEEHAFFGSDRLHLIAQLIGEKFTDGLVQYSKQ